MKIRITFKLNKEQLHQLIEAGGQSYKSEGEKSFIKVLFKERITDAISDFVGSVDGANPLKAFKVEVSK